MDRTLWLHSAVDGHLGSSYVGYGAENIRGQGFVFSVPLGNTPRTWNCYNSTVEAYSLSDRGHVVNFRFLIRLQEQLFKDLFLIKQS